MNQKETQRFQELYQRHLNLLKLQGKSQSTIKAYARAVRQAQAYFDCSLDQVTPEQFESYFLQRVETHSWSTVKIDHLGLQFFWRFVLKRDWEWINIVKPPKVKSIPDILTVSEIERLIGATRKLRYRVFLLTTYSWDCAWEKPWLFKSVILMPNVIWSTSAVAKAIKIVWFHYPPSH